jgi:hypothetical protein
MWEKFTGRISINKVTPYSFGHYNSLSYSVSLVERCSCRCNYRRKDKVHLLVLVGLSLMRYPAREMH